MGKRRIEVSEKFVRTRLSAGDTITGIARQLGISHVTLRDRCDEMGICMKPRHIVYERLDALHTARIYEEWQVSVKLLSKESGIHAKMICDYLRDRGVRVRSGSEQYAIDMAQARAAAAWRERVDVRYYFQTCESAGCNRKATKCNKATGKQLCVICWKEYQRDFPDKKGI